MSHPGRWILHFVKPSGPTKGMSNQSDQDSYTEELDEDKLLAGLSAEEIQQLQDEMEVIAPDERVPAGVKQRDVVAQAGNKEQNTEEEEEIDEDEILAGLSAEELKELQNEIEVIAPDERVPVGMRQKDQTDKPPTGSFDHRSLVEYLYWEKESNRLLEEERVPTTLLPSRKKTEKEIRNGEEKEDENDVECAYEETEEQVGGGKGEEATEEAIEEVIEEVVGAEDNRVEEQNRQPIKRGMVKNGPAVSVTSQEISQPPPQFSGSKNGGEAPRSEQNERELMVADEKRSDQLHSEPAPSVYENWVPEKEERVISKLKIPKLALGNGLSKKTARPSGNETNLERTLDKIRKNNPSVTDVNLNNIENIPKEMLLDYVEALRKNKHVKTFSIANTGADENVAFSLANMLRENRSITTLNIESNFITGKGIIAIMRCLQFNETLTELRFHNQRHMLGHHAEMEVSRLLKANSTLLKLGYHFELPGPRMVVTNLLTRNLDRQRQQRKEEQRLQQMKERQQIMEMYESSLNLPPGLLQMLGGYIPETAFLQAAQEPREVLPRSPEPSPVSSPIQQLRNTQPSPRQPPSSLASGSGNPLKDVQLKKTPKRRDPFLELNPGEERRNGRANIQLRSTPKQRSAASEGPTDDKANLRDMIKTLKPIPRRRQPPKVDLTPRDLLLSEIRQSNVAYLKAVPLPKVLESRETSLF
ncbi:leiomodin-3 isoform X1 [Electrophorus electricus]|uniref:leiomodin-3 isoform X1 n=1 Tax=Electrophorus electricus TaxID=8005 RepID=UPI0015D069BE|nr:leiomodin-3 isoform X1 [Electrophorus electricus]